MPSIGTLVGFLRLDDSQYQRALKAAQSQTRAFASGLTSAFLRIAGPAALAGSMVALGRRALDTADRFDDLATRINASFEGVQVLEHLAKDFGNDASVFTQGGDRIQQALAEVAAGNLKTAATFRQLGVDAASLQGLKLEQQLEVLARAIVNAEDQQRAFLAVTELLGTRAAPQLKAALVALGTDGYDALQKKTAESVGLMTEEQGKQLAAAKRQIEDFQTFLTIKAGEVLAGVRGMINRSDFDRQISFIRDSLRTLQEMKPELEVRFGERSRQLLTKQVFDLADIVVDSTDEATEDQIQAARQWLAYLTNTLGTAGELHDTTARRILGTHVVLENQLQRLLDQRTAAEKEAAEKRAAINQAPAGAPGQPVPPPPAPAAENVRMTQLDTSFARTGAEELELRILRLNEALRAGTISEAAYARGLQDVRDNARAVRTPLEAYAIEVRELDEALADGLISQDAHARAVEDAREKLRTVRTPLEAYAAEVRDLNRALADGTISQNAYDRELRELTTNLRTFSTPADTYLDALAQIDLAQKDGTASAEALALAIRNATRDLGKFKLAALQESIDASGGGEPGGTNASRSAQRALDRARKNAARGNLGAAEDDLRRVNELTGGKTPTTLEDMLGRQGVPGQTPPPDRIDPSSNAGLALRNRQRELGFQGAIPPAVPPAAITVPPSVPPAAPAAASSESPAGGGLMGELQALVKELKVISGKLVVA